MLRFRESRGVETANRAGEKARQRSPIRRRAREVDRSQLGSGAQADVKPDR